MDRPTSINKYSKLPPLPSSHTDSNSSVLDDLHERLLFDHTDDIDMNKYEDDHFGSELRHHMISASTDDIRITSLYDRWNKIKVIVHDKISQRKKSAVLMTNIEGQDYSNSGSDQGEEERMSTIDSDIDEEFKGAEKIDIEKVYSNIKKSMNGTGNTSTTTTNKAPINMMKTTKSNNKILIKKQQGVSQAATGRIVSNYNNIKRIDTGKTNTINGHLLSSKVSSFKSRLKQLKENNI